MTNLDRRTLLTLMGASATVGCASVSLSGASSAAGAEGTSLESSARLVGYGDHIIPMNAANLAPMFTSVELAVDEYARTLRRDVSFPTRGEFVATKVEPARQKVAAMLGVADAADIAFVRNTSEGNSTLINGINLSAGDEVVLWSENHATNKTSWQYRSEVTPITVRNVFLSVDEPDDADIVEAFANAINDRTKVLAFSHISNISGRRLPAKEIIAAARAKNHRIHVHVDGAQSWGSVKLNLADMDCDTYSASAHKYLLGPRGAGIFYVKRSAVQRIRPVTLGYNLYFTYPEDGLADTAERFECHGQRDVAAFAAIGDAVDAHTAFGGPAAVEQSIADIVDYAKTTLSANDVPIASPGAGHGVIVMDLGHSARAMAGFLMLHQAQIAAAFVTGAQASPNSAEPVYLRISPHIYNTREHIDLAVGVIDTAQHMPVEDAQALVSEYL